MMAMLTSYMCGARALLVCLCVSLFTYELVSALLTFYEGDVVTVSSLVGQEEHPRPWICFSSKYLMRQSLTNQVRRTQGKTNLWSVIYC